MRGITFSLLPHIPLSRYLPGVDVPFVVISVSIRKRCMGMLFGHDPQRMWWPSSNTLPANFPDVKEVVIEDDTFTANKKRVLDICRLLVEKKLNKRLKWLCNARVGP